MRSYTDMMTKEKVYEYVCPSETKIGGAEISGGYSVRDMLFSGEVFKPLPGTNNRAPFDTMKIRYPHYFRKEGADGIKRGYIFGLDESRRLVYFDAGEPSAVNVTLTDVVYDSEPVFIDYNFNGKDYLIVNGGESGFFVYDGNFYKAEENPLVTGAAMYDNKLFACSTENYPRVKYMTPSDPTSWSSNFASLSVYNECGMAKNIATLKNYIYVFQENGISRISRAETDNYSVAKIMQTGETIYGETVKTVGSDVWFFTSGGLYRFDGNRAEKIAYCSGAEIKGSRSARIEQFGGKIFAAARISFGTDADDGGEENNALIVADAVSGVSAVYCGVSVRSFCAMKDRGELMLSFYDDTVAFWENSELFLNEKRTGYYVLEKSVLGFPGRKNVSFVKMKTSGGAVITVTADGKKSVYNLTGKNRTQFVRINKTAEEFSLEIATQGEMTAPVIYFSEVN